MRIKERMFTSQRKMQMRTVWVCILPYPEYLLGTEKKFMIYMY